MTVPHGYYAVPDPDQPGTTTLWRSCARTRHGATVTMLVPYPDGAQYGPVLYKRDVPKRQPERDQIRSAFFARRAAWDKAVHDAIAADLDAARTLFAGDTVHCYSCGRALTDETSVALGVGPECRRPPGPRYTEQEIRDAINSAVETTQAGHPHRTWTWDRPIQGRARKREKVTVRWYPEAVPQPGYSPRDHACATVLDRLNSKQPLCTGPVLWSVTWTGDGPLSHTAHYCDADMPADYRPATAPAPAVEQHSLF